MINRYNDYYNVTKAIINHQYFDGLYHPLMVNSGIVDPLAVPRLGGLLSTKLSDAFGDHRSFPQQNEGLFRPRRNDARTSSEMRSPRRSSSHVRWLSLSNPPYFFLGGGNFFP